VADLAGKKVLITGTLLEVGRAEAKRKLTALGAEVVDRLTDDIGYVVAGQEGGRNLFLAKQASLPIITEPVLLPLLAQAPEGEADNRPAVPGPDALPGLRLVIAGKLNRVDRAQARRKLQRAGAQVVDDVEAGVACVFAGEKGGRNLLLALQQSLPVFDERALTDLLDQLPDAAPQDAPGAAPDLPDLGGRTVVLTGKLQHIDRRDAVDRLRRLGATLLERVDDHPDFVITGDKGGRAVFVAKQESIPVLDEETLLAILDRAGLPRSEAGAPGPGGAAAPPDLRGATVAFTGTFPDLDLAAVKQRLCAHDVTVHPGITAATQYVVVGVKPSQTTLFRVKQLGLDTLDAATLLAFLQD
jgi:NAD-dependent DNA ligase